jgi:N-dimethylarginine dimethylaminohydrolase
MTAVNEYGALRRVAVRHAGAVFPGHEDQWQALRFTERPDPARAAAEFDVFMAILAEAGAEVVALPEDEGLTLDAIYARDASVVTPRGVVLCRMGKPARSAEPAAQGRALGQLGLTIAGAIEPPGLLEGGDVVWFDDTTVAVGRGYRTNSEGIGQLRTLAGPSVEVTVVGLPHYRGPDDVFHLMSIVSPVDRDLAVVYSPLMPVPFRQWLLERGLTLVEVPDEEFEAMGCNVLAIGPRTCVMADGAPETRRRLEAAGARVSVYQGREISLKGGGGPTCLTRPLDRA